MLLMRPAHTNGAIPLSDRLNVNGAARHERAIELDPAGATRRYVDAVFLRRDVGDTAGEIARI